MDSCSQTGLGRVTCALVDRAMAAQSEVSVLDYAGSFIDWAVLAEVFPNLVRVNCLGGAVRCAANLSASIGELTTDCACSVVEALTPSPSLALVPFVGVESGVNGVGTNRSVVVAAFEECMDGFFAEAGRVFRGKTDLSCFFSYTGGPGGFLAILFAVLLAMFVFGWGGYKLRHSIMLRIRPVSPFFSFAM